VQQPGLREAGVVHDDVRDSQRVLAGSEEALDGILLTDVEWTGVDLGTGLSRALRHRFEAIDAAGAQRQAPALVGACQCDRLPEPGGGPRDQNGAAPRLGGHAEYASASPGRGHA
jgi:hypothetical protein